MSIKTRITGMIFPISSVLFAAACIMLLNNAYKSNDFYINYQNTNAEFDNNDVIDSGGNKASLININTADISELSEIPGIGETLALRIIEYRTEYGEFIAISEITSVRGIGEATFEKIKDYITV